MIDLNERETNARLLCSMKSLCILGKWMAKGYTYGDKAVFPREKTDTPHRVEVNLQRLPFTDPTPGPRAALGLGLAHEAARALALVGLHLANGE